LYDLQIPLIKNKAVDEKKEVIKDVRDRWYEIEAAIVRIIKSHKSLYHADLLARLDALLESKFKVFLGTCLSSLSCFFDQF
jgi:hypothetical protein